MKLSLFAAGFLLLALLTQAIATTNYNGSASFTTTRGLNNIIAYCPDQTYCTSQLTDVQNTSYLDFTCACKLASITINATWKDDNANSALNGKPVAFVYAFSGEPAVGAQYDFTGPDGLAEIKMPNGLQLITLAICVQNETGQCYKYFTASMQANLSQQKQTLNVILSSYGLRTAGYNETQIYSDGIALNWRAQDELADSAIGRLMTPVSVFKRQLNTSTINAAYGYIQGNTRQLTAYNQHETPGQYYQTGNNCRSETYSYDACMDTLFDILGSVMFISGGLEGTLAVGPLEGIAAKTFAKNSAGQLKTIAARETSATADTRIINARPNGPSLEIQTAGKTGSEEIRYAKTLPKTNDKITTEITRNAVGAQKEWAAAIASKFKLQLAWLGEEGFVIDNEFFGRSFLSYEGKELKNFQGATGQTSFRKMLEAGGKGKDVVSYSLPTGKVVTIENYYRFTGKENGVVGFENLRTGAKGDFDLPALVYGKPTVYEVKIWSFSHAESDLTDIAQGQAKEQINAAKFLFQRQDVEFGLAVPADIADRVTAARTSLVKQGINGKLPDTIVSLPDNLADYQNAARIIARG